MKQGFQRGMMFLRTGTNKDSENEENNITVDISEHHWMIDELGRIEDRHCQPGVSSTIPGIMVASTSETTSLKLTEKKEKNKSSSVIIGKEQENKNKTKNKDLKTCILTNVKNNETDNDIFDAYGSGDKLHDGTQDADMKNGGEEQTRPSADIIGGEDKILLLFDDDTSDFDREETDKRDGRGENEKDIDMIGQGNEKDANNTPVHFDFVAFESVEMLYNAYAATSMTKGDDRHTGPIAFEKKKDLHRQLTILAGMTREKEGAIDGTLPSHNGNDLFPLGSNPCSSNGSIRDARKRHETMPSEGLSQPPPTAVVFGFLAKALTSLFAFFQGNSLNKLFPSMILLLFPLASVAASSTTTTSISMHKSSLCDINDAVPFKQMVMDATLGECKYQCISLRTCSGMQYVDPKQCILYDVPFSSIKSVDDDALTCGIKEKIFSDEVVSNQLDAFVHHFGSKCGEAIDYDHATRVTGLDSFSACEDRCFAMEHCNAFDWKGSSKNVCNILEDIVVERDILPVLGLDIKSDRICGVRIRKDKSEAGDKHSFGQRIKNSDILNPFGEIKESRSLEEAAPAYIKSESEQNDFALDVSKSFQMSLESFMLLSSFKFDDSNREWCVMSDTLNEDSRIKMWPCPDVKNLKHWFYIDFIGRFRLSVKPDLCLRWQEGTRLLFKDCSLRDSPNYTFDLDLSNGTLRARGMKDENSLWLLGVKVENKYGFLRLFNAANHADSNSSLYLWYTIYASESPSLVPSSQPTSQPSSSPSSKPSPSPSRRPSPSPSTKPTPIPSEAPSDQPSLKPSSMPSEIPSDVPSDQPSLLPSSMPSDIPSDVPSDQPSLLPSSMPSDIPSDVPSDQPSSLPSSMPSDIPSDVPSDQPSSLPSSMPSDIPSDVPSDQPSSLPSSMPSDIPSDVPSDQPSSLPSSMPSDIPSDVPSDQPSSLPSSMPSDIPSDQPSSLPSSMPSDIPSVVPSDQPSSLPSSMPSDIPSDVPSDQPTSLPSSMPSDIPSDIPSDQPSSLPSSMPSDIPSDIPSDQPSSLPSSIPSVIPSDIPSDQPSSLPSSMPSDIPSDIPSNQPSVEPSICRDEEGWIVGGIPNKNNLYAGLTCQQIATANSDSWCDAIMAQSNSTYLGKSVVEACCACQGSTYKTTYPSSSPSDKPSISNSPTVEPIPSSQPTDCIDEPEFLFYNGENDDIGLGCSDLIVNLDEDMCERFENIDFNGKTVLSACCICGGGTHQSREPSSSPSKSQIPSSEPSMSVAPSDTPSILPSLNPTASSEPSNFPSSYGATIIDGKPCRYSRECFSSFSSEVYDDNACLKDSGDAIGLCKPGVLHRQVTTVNFQLLKNEKYFSKDFAYYLIFEEEGNLRLKDSSNDADVWSAIDNFPEEGYIDNTCFLQRNGNLVIFDSTNKPLWTSSQDLLEVCHGNCLSDDHCTPGLICYSQTSRRRLLEDASDGPSDQPSSVPSSIPSDIPSDQPSDTPSDVPSYEPSDVPSDQPSDTPSDVPSYEPSDVPSDQPSDTPSDVPSHVPSDVPSDAPSDIPSDQPSLLPSSIPSAIPSDIPSYQTSSVPSLMPSAIPSDIPSDQPSNMPSVTPVPGCSGPNDGSTNFCIDPSFSDSSPKIGEIIDKGQDAFSLIENLGLCEGNCDTNCADGLVCISPDQDGSVRGCYGISNANYKYCTYPILDNSKSSSGSLDYTESFFRITNTGILQVYGLRIDLSVASEKFLVWDSINLKNSNPVSESNDFEHGSDLSISTARDIFFSGDFTHHNLIMDIVENDSSGLQVTTSSIEIHGSTSKSYEFASPIDVNKNTMISFDVTLGNGVKAIALCVDVVRVASDSSTDGGLSTKCLAIGGTASSLSSSEEAPYEGILSDYVLSDITVEAGIKTSMEYKLSEMFPTRLETMKYIGIIQVVNENDASVTSSLIEDLLFADDNSDSQVNRKLTSSSEICVCGPNELASTQRAGLHHTCSEALDFCSSAEEKLKEITKNENEFCSSHFECRSGLCQNDKCTSRSMKITERVFPGKDLEIKKVFSIENREYEGRYIFVPGCDNLQKINYTSEGNDLGSLFFRGDDGATLHSVRCGTTKAVHLDGGQCSDFTPIIMHDTDRSKTHQKWIFAGDGQIKSQKCNSWNLSGYLAPAYRDGDPQLYLGRPNTGNWRKWNIDYKGTAPKLSNCEGGCWNNDHCRPGLICEKGITTDITSVAGCFGIPEAGAGYCSEPGLLRNIVWHGTYGDQNTFIGSEGGSNVDDINGIQLFGNVWKAYQLEQPYSVTGNTHVSFKFKMIKEAEGHAICFDDDDVADTYGGFQKRCIVLAGTEFDHWDNHHVHKVVLHNRNQTVVDTETGSVEAVVDVKIGHFFNRKGNTIKFIGFVQDNDAAPFEGISSFRDIQIFEVEPNSAWEIIPKPESEKDFDASSVDVLSQAVSYNREFQAVVMNECFESDRTEEISQNMYLRSQTSFTTPLRKLRCTRQHCGRMEVYTDIKSGPQFMENSAQFTISQFTGTLGEQSASFKNGALQYGDFSKTFRCPGDTLATKFIVNTSDSKETFRIRIRNRRLNKRLYLTVRGCTNGSIIFGSSEDGLNTRFYFGNDGEVLHSALCGDSKAVDLEGANCDNYNVFMWTTHGGSNQKWYFDGGELKVEKCSSRSAFLFFNRLIMVPSNNIWLSLISFIWEVKNRRTQSIREMSCSNVKPNAGLKVHGNVFEESRYITSSYGSEYTQCPNGYMVAGFECSDTFCNKLRLLCKMVEIIPRYTITTSFKIYTKANDWGSETDFLLIHNTELAITNHMRGKRECFSEYGQNLFRGEGLGFPLSNEEVFYFNGEADVFVRYSINIDGTLGVRSEESFVNGNYDTSFNSVSKPIGFGQFDRSDEFSDSSGNLLVAAVSAASTKSPKELVNSGAIAFYTRINNAWHLKGEVYGQESEDKLGLLSVEFIGQHDLKVVSDNYFIDYVSDKLNECPFHANMVHDTCICDEGYIAVNNADTLTRRLIGADYCVLAFFSTLLVHEVENEQSLISIIINNNDSFRNISIQQFSEGSNNPEDVGLILNENMIVTESPDAGESTTVTLIGLNPGRRYLTTITLGEEETVNFPLVPSCSCSSLTNNDQTGRPMNLRLIQDRGHVILEFTDNSKCESGFSFTRFLGYAEFIDDSKHATSFAPDFLFQAPKQCNSIITPETEASDDLTISRLLVGQVYSYCVRAIKEGNYMDLTPNAQELRALSSSSAICESHRIAWESSISGFISSTPDAGSLAIKNVHVHWQLLSEDGRPLSCSGCIGSTKTDDGGLFNIDFNIQNEADLFQTNDADIPVNLYFSKTTTSNGTAFSHRFLCNQGQDICDNDAGHTVYLKHLHFDSPVHIYDDTNLPFSGKLLIHGTNCPIMNARVCPLHKASSAQNLEVLVGDVCVETNSYGEYTAPVVIGSVIYGVRIEYEEHIFERTFENKWNYEAGVTITEGGFYGMNDFYDMSKARLIIHVAGGQCNHSLGTASIEIRIRGCDSSLHDGGYLDQDFTQSSFEKIYNAMPAHFLNIRIIEVHASDTDASAVITNYFLSEDPRSINLLRTAEEDQALNTVIEEEEESTSNTGTPNEGLDDIESVKTAETLKETIRFQYDGNLKMEVSVVGDRLECEKDPATIPGDSFHVVDYMQLIDISVKLEFEIIPNTLFCNLVDTDKHKLFIESNLGMDKNSGFDEFYNGLGDDQEQDLISKCSTIAPPPNDDGVVRSADGPCLLNINSSNSGSGLDITLTVGRPNISSPYTKRVNIRVQGADTDLQHRADFFIVGLFSKGPKESFALPTHQPIMVLRDPPGSGSFASYENIRTSIRIFETDDKTGTEGTIKIKTGLSLDPTFKLCSGGGFGAVILGCKDPVAGENDGAAETEYEVETGTAKSKRTTSNTFSTTWSYSTSTDAGIAGEESDIFVVPNLNVAFEEVLIVDWSNETCAAKLDGDDFPSSVIFDLESESSKPALSFYSRYHIVTTKMEEISNAIDAKGREVGLVLNSINDVGDDVCCVSGEGYCVEDEPRRKCTADDHVYEFVEFEELSNAGDAWVGILDTADLTKAQAIANDQEKSILNWFESQKKNQYFKRAGYDEEKVDLDMAFSGLAPESLTDGALPLDYYADPIQENEKLQKANRLQFSGAGGSYQLTLNRASSVQFSTMTCENENIMKFLDWMNGILSLSDPTTAATTGISEAWNIYQELKEKHHPGRAVTKQLSRGGKKWMARVANRHQAWEKEQAKAKIEAERRKKLGGRQGAKKDLFAENKKKKLETLRNQRREYDLKIEKDPSKQIFRQDASSTLVDKDPSKQLNRQDASSSLVDNDPSKQLNRQDRSSDLLNKKDIEKAMNEKKRQERSDLALKQRKESIAAESAGKAQKGSKGSTLVKKLGKGLGLAMSSAPILIGSYIAGCDYKTTSEAEPAELSYELSAFGIGVTAGFSGDFQVVVEHESARTDNEEESTSVSVTFTDADFDDEFVVDMYYDELYGTFIFDTVSGRSRCMWEKGTGRAEDPTLVVLESASSYIFPDESMIFEVEMNNIGKTQDSLFYLAQEHAQNRPLDVILVGGDGSGINTNGNVIHLFRDNPVIRQIKVERGINGYEFPPVQLILKSKCESDLNMRQDDVSGLYVTVPLYNHINEAGEPVLKWIEPCPKIYWSGNLKRERTFLVNKNTVDANNGEMSIPIQIFNPLATSSGKNITDLRDDGKLESIRLRYRRVGDISWDSALIAQTISPSNSPTDLDFLIDELEVDEDPFGFSSLVWSLDTVQQGQVEIMLEIKCSAPAGAPEEVMGSRESVITGFFDIEPPDQYGRKALPLRHDILFGEELEVLFTEEINCQRPFSFSINVDIIGTNYIGLRIGENIQVNCHQNTLGFNFKNLDQELIAGKEFEVEIQNVMDRNYNEIELPIQFTKRFAELNFDSASITFKFQVDANCTQESVEEDSSEIRSTIANNLGLDSDDRIQINLLTCNVDGMIDADAKILPETDGRRLRAVEKKEAQFLSKSTLELMNILKNNRNGGNNNNHGRRLHVNSEQRLNAYSITSINVIPSNEDKLKFRSSKKELAEEERLKRESLGIVDDPEHAEPVLDNEIKELERELKESIAKEKIEEIKELKDSMEREKKEEMRELKDNMNNMMMIQSVLILVVGSVLGTIFYLQSMRSKNIA